MKNVFYPLLCVGERNYTVSGREKHVNGNRKGQKVVQVFHCKPADTAMHNKEANRRIFALLE
jgi:hypothetical protein